LGRKSDEWDSIRDEMKKEFESNKAYSDQKFLDNVWGAGDDRKDIVDSLAWRDKEQQAPLKYWMTFPAHGYLIADTYQRPVILLSEQMPATYLPLSQTPNNNPPICLILLPDYSHFISFTFKAEIWPCPRIDPFWKFYVSDEARGWEDWIEAHVELGQKVLYPPVRRSLRFKKAPVDVD
jgi:hypothetical protein